MEIICVDNHSSDGSQLQLLEVTSPTLTVVPLNQNMGFAAAVCCGTQFASGKKFWILNPDTEVEGDSFHKVVRLCFPPGVGIIGTRILNPDQSVQASCRRFPEFLHLLILAMKINRIVVRCPFWRRYVMADDHPKAMSVVDQVSGASMVISRDVWTELSGLDTSFWIWYEEVDFCKRARLAGWLTLYLPDVSIVHSGAGSFNRLSSPLRHRLMMRSMGTYANRYFGSSWGCAIKLAGNFGATLVAVGFLVRRVLHMSDRTGSYGTGKVGQM